MDDFSENLTAAKLPSALLERYLIGEASPDECARVEGWRTSTPAAAALLAALTSSGLELETEPPVQLDPALGWAAVARRFEPGTGRESVRSQDRSARRSVIWHMSAGAIGLLTVCMIFLLRSHAPATRGPAQSYATSMGQRAIVTFSGGNRITLAPGTTLCLDPSTRVATLTGDAYFEIAESRRTPFSVYAHGIGTRVLGTSFDVRHYPEDETVQIFVTAGKVSVSRITTVRGVTLTGGMVAVASDSSTIRLLSDDATQYTGWTTGQLVFHKTLARDVATALGRAYGVEIRIADSTLATQSLSWSVVVTQRSLLDVLESLGVVLDAHPVQRGHIITLVPGKALSRQPLPQPRSLTTLESQYGR